MFANDGAGFPKIVLMVIPPLFVHPDNDDPSEENKFEKDIDIIYLKYIISQRAKRSTK